MALPTYYTTGQRIWHRTYLVYCGIVLFFLVMPLIAIIPLSFTASPFLDFTPGMLRLDPEAFSTRWYKMMVGDCSAADITTVCSDKWVIGARNSLVIAIVATVLATAIGTIAALGLSRADLVGRRAIMAFLISPMIVPLIITAAGMFLFYAKLELVASFTGVIFAHTVLGLPFVVITVTATLVGFDQSLTRAAQGLGGTPVYNFFRVQLPLIAPGVISGALFAFITSFDEVVIILFLGGAEQLTLPRQMWAGIRQEISPTILAAATVLVIFSILLLTTVELLRRRSERLRGMSPG